MLAHADHRAACVLILPPYYACPCHSPSSSPCRTRVRETMGPGRPRLAIDEPSRASLIPSSHLACKEAAGIDLVFSEQMSMRGRQRDTHRLKLFQTPAQCLDRFIQIGPVLLRGPTSAQYAASAVAQAGQGCGKEHPANSMLCELFVPGRLPADQPDAGQDENYARDFPHPDRVTQHQGREEKRRDRNQVDEYPGP